jgi:hypothetical protein
MIIVEGLLGLSTITYFDSWWEFSFYCTDWDFLRVSLLVLGVSIYFIDGIGVFTYLVMVGATLGTDEDIFKGSL